MLPRLAVMGPLRKAVQVVGGAMPVAHACGSYLCIHHVCTAVKGKM
jgi:hypothetical protein